MAGWSDHKGNFLKYGTKTTCEESYSLTVDNRKNLASEVGQENSHGPPTMSLMQQHHQKYLTFNISRAGYKPICMGCLKFLRNLNCLCKADSLSGLTLISPLSQLQDKHCNVYHNIF